MREDRYTADEASRAAVYNCIGSGRQAGMTRYDISEKTGLSDRIVRAAIHDLRAEGHIIITDGASGYYFPDDKDDLERWTRIELSRLKRILEAVRPAIEELGDYQ